MGGVRSEVEVTVLIHRGYLDDGNVRLGHIAVPVEAGKLTVAHRRVEGESLFDGLALDAAHMPGVPGHMFRRVFNLEDLRYPHADAAAEIHIVKLRKALRNFLIYCNRNAGGPAVINPVTGFNDGCGLFRRYQFFLIHFCHIHICPPCPFKESICSHQFSILHKHCQQCGGEQSCRLIITVITINECIFYIDIYLTLI